MDSRRARPGGSRPKLRKACSPHRAVPISPRHFTPQSPFETFNFGTAPFSRLQSRGKPERAVHVRCYRAMTLGRTQANRCGVTDAARNHETTIRTSVEIRQQETLPDCIEPEIIEN
ncbi:hypothetical protein B296_00026329 [Ensete ventricosum]|uniref:Uncharacterized protein n=1 Tax=Ensete ventricosum TaxID=4639 RepID=A0A426YG48_ENSVE|nr:hypothetical protein B296_00026329 [Ensete ventricosum]